MSDLSGLMKHLEGKKLTDEDVAQLTEKVAETMRKALESRLGACPVCGEVAATLTEFPLKTGEKIRVWSHPGKTCGEWIEAP